MKKYENLDNFSDRTHKVEVTLQLSEFKGKFSFDINGNCSGIDILRCIDETIIKDINRCDMIGETEVELIGCDDDNNSWFRCNLFADNGDECEHEDMCDNFGRLITGINIVGCDIIQED